MFASRCGWARLASIGLLIGCGPAVEGRPTLDTTGSPGDVGRAPAIAHQTPPRGSTTQLPDFFGDTSGADIAGGAREVLVALKARNADRIAALTHPVRGLRFSAYPAVRPDSDVVLQRTDIASIFRDSTPRQWGYADGSGHPLILSFERYYRRFVYDVDFAAAPVVQYNQGPVRGGNTGSNIARVGAVSRHIAKMIPASLRATPTTATRCVLHPGHIELAHPHINDAESA